MQISSKNKEINFDNYQFIDEDLDPTQRAWIEVNGIAIEKNVRQLRSRLKKIVN